jgi:RNA polymerase sigma-70 factor (ECF subfamily)
MFMGLEEKTDEQIIAAYLAGENGSLRETVAILYNGNRDRLTASMVRLVRNQSTAEEIVQDAFLRVQKHLDGFDTSKKFYTWLYKIAFNLFITHTRKSKNYFELLLDETILSEDGKKNGKHIYGALMTRFPQPDQIVHRQELGRSIGRAIDGLPEQYREAFVLREMQGFSYEEISTVLGIKLGTIRSRISRARGLLKKTLLQEGIESSNI